MLSRRCQTASRIALTVETAIHAADPLGLPLESAVVVVAAVAAPAGSEWQVRRWMWAACCSGCASSADCKGTASSLSIESKGVNMRTKF